MEEILRRKEGESLGDYKERLYRNKKDYEIEWEDIGELLGKDQNPDHIRKTSYGYLERIEDEKDLKQFDKSIMIINDIHCPYEREDVLENIRKHANEIKTLVIGGDLMDCESISSFPKINRLTLVEELIYTYNFVKKIRKILDNEQQIIMINGNHEERLKMQICKMHEKELQKFINPNILEMLVDGFTIYEEDKKVKYKGIENLIFIPHWYVNIDNKIIVCHPKDFSQVDGKMCEKVSEHFLNKGEKFETIVFAHTHKYSQMIVSRRQGTFVVENGCLCKPHDYADCGKLSYTPQDYCYTTINYNNNEKINYNNIRVHYLKELYDKKENYNINL